MLGLIHLVVVVVHATAETEQPNRGMCNNGWLKLILFDSKREILGMVEQGEERKEQPFAPDDDVT